MTDLKSVLKADPAAWLLEKDNPSVRYFALTDVQGKLDTDSEAKKAKDDIMRVGLVPEILAKQNNEGCWEPPKSFYTAKYRGTVWQLVILAELGADGKHERVKKACEFILENSQDHDSGGFSMHASGKTGGGRHSEVIPCLTGNVVWSLVRLGYLENPQVVRGINWITTLQRFDDGIEDPPKGWPYDRFEMCWGKHTCHMGAVKALKALAEIPADKRSKDVINTIGRGAEHMLEHHIHKRSHDLSRVSKPGWRRFSFPLMYQTDVLEILGILTRLGYKDKRMQEAIDLVISKQDEQGRWRMEDTFNGRFQVEIEQKGKPSKWITLKALEVLKRFYS
ncbi:nitrogen fixation protein NifH [Candidatus Bathyarchaeota archaeon RBG_16_48_13]|nr:MAG: nitrogen fixation protein NifH [Candidatus Bathyarchaeota archaeon RBG_16_48_13]